MYVLTEETLNGWLARLGALAMPNRMSRWHQRWLEGLREGGGEGDALSGIALTTGCQRDADANRISNSLHLVRFRSRV